MKVSDIIGWSEEKEDINLPFCGPCSAPCLGNVDHVPFLFSYAHLPPLLFEIPVQRTLLMSRCSQKEIKINNQQGYHLISQRKPRESSVWLRKIEGRTKGIC